MPQANSPGLGLLHIFLSLIALLGPGGGGEGERLVTERSQVGAVGFQGVRSSPSTSSSPPARGTCPSVLSCRVGVRLTWRNIGRCRLRHEFVVLQGDDFLLRVPEVVDVGGRNFLYTEMSGLL